MKLHADRPSASNTITGYGDGFVAVNQTTFRHSVWLAPEGEIHAWPPAAAEAIDTAALQAIVAAKPDVLILGTGAAQRFLSPALARLLRENGIGVEAMNTQAACRTYNILMSEGRNVVAALIVAP